MADRVSEQVVAQMSQQREQIPIFDVNQGNTVLNLLSTTENDRCLLDSVNYELGFHVPNNLKLKIVNGEYIDIGKLLVKMLILMMMRGNSHLRMVIWYWKIKNPLSPLILFTSGLMLLSGRVQSRSGYIPIEQ